MGLNCEVGINSSSHDKPGIGNGMMTWLYRVLTLRITESQERGKLV